MLGNLCICRLDMVDILVSGQDRDRSYITLVSGAQWPLVPSGPHCQLPGAACVLVKAGTTFNKISQQMQAASRDRVNRDRG